MYLDNDMDLIVDALQLADDFSLIIDAALTGSYLRLDRTGAITAATNATPIVVTSAAHGLTTGDQVVITDVEGNQATNKLQTITVVDANLFSLNGSTGSGAYTSGGVWYLGVVGATGITLTYSATRKRYRGVIPGTVPFANATRYLRIIDCANYRIHWETEVLTEKRR